MSSLPLLLNLIDELDRESYNPSYFGNDFGLGLCPRHIHRRPLHHHSHHQRAVGGEPLTNMVGYATMPTHLLGRQQSRRCIRNEIAAGNVGGAVGCAGAQLSAVGKDGFQVCMDVAQFKPNELNVKVVQDSVIVEGKHEEREDDHGYITRHFLRRYTLPKGYDAEKVTSTLSSDGVLTVRVPKPQLEDHPNERSIQIQQVGPAHLNVKENGHDEECEKDKSIGEGEGEEMVIIANGEANGECAEK